MRHLAAALVALALLPCCATSSIAERRQESEPVRLGSTEAKSLPTVEAQTGPAPTSSTQPTDDEASIKAKKAAPAESSAANAPGPAAVPQTKQESTDDSRAEDDKWVGFRKITWNTSLSKLTGMKVVSSLEEGKKVICSREDDEMKIGRASIQSIYYLFINDAFSGVVINTSTEYDFNGLKEALYARYGKPDKANATLNEYSWTHIGDAQSMVGIELKYNVFSHQGECMIKNLLNVLKNMVDDMETAKKGAEKDF
jgi:hypothetical protein